MVWYGMVDVNMIATIHSEKPGSAAFVTCFYFDMVYSFSVNTDLYEINIAFHYTK